MKRHLLSAILLLLSAGIFSQAGDRILAEISGNMASHRDLYRYLHQNPELSYEEFRTAARLSYELEALDFEVSRNIGGNGFVGVLKNGEGPVIMLRTDMDALPLEEKTRLPFASEAPGVMHACGHDMHMTVWLGTAKVLSAMTDSWKGTLVMLAQPAEERGGGAKAMIAG
jgi:amidohydrolase